MITRIARALLLLQFLFAVAFFLLLSRVWQLGDVLAAVLAVVLVLVLRLLITANSFLASSFYRDPAVQALSWRQRFDLFRGEFFATMLSSSWSMPFCAFEKRPVSNPRGLPVLLLHGYGCNSGYWHPLSKALSVAGITHHAVSLEPVFGDIDHYVPAVRKAVDTLCADTGENEIIIVAHSMGGLVARAYLRDCGNQRVAKVITLGTPHRGTGLANFGIGKNSRQMRWRQDANGGVVSEWLRQLAQAENNGLATDFVSIYSQHDNIVSPQKSSWLDGARHIALQGVGHVALALDKRVQAIVIEEILTASGSVQALEAGRQ